MQIRNAIKVIVVLLLILIALLTALLIITSVTDKDRNDPDGTDSTSSSTTVGTTAPDTTDTEPSGTTAGGTTAPDGTTSATDTTAPSGTTTEPTGTTTADDQKDPPSVTAPEGFTMSKILTTDSGTGLNLRAEIRGEEQDGRVKVTVLLYLDYYSIYIGARNGCKLSIDDVSETFTMNAIEEENDEKHSMYICHAEKLCDYGESVDIYARVPVRITYAGVEIEYLEIDQSITVSK